MHSAQGHSALRLIALGLGALVALGCAYGGGGDRLDSGIVIRMDSGPQTDGGTPPGFDSGPRRDSSVPGVDSGTRDSGGGGTCPESPCRLIPPQCGCPAGQGCYLGSGSTRVCGTPGPEVEGQTCSGTTACQAGLLCTSQGSANFCSRFCASDADCTGGAGSLCLLNLNDGSGGTLPGVQLCTIHCNPASTTSACPSGAGCALYQEEAGAMRFFTGCRPAGTGTAGSICVDTDDCATGYFCGDLGLGNECIRYCTYPGGTCGIGEVCNPFTDMPRVGGVEYGYCA